jgi:uncharacterized delta-60 repeat protein
MLKLGGRDVVGASVRRACSTRFKRIVLLLAATLAAPFAHALPGQPGTLDTTWAASSPLGAGKLITSIGAGDDFARAITVQPDGKFVLSGDCRDAGARAFCELRYNANGTLDTSFGTGGFIVTPVGAEFDFVNAVVRQPDGKTVVTGPCFVGTDYSFCTRRYNVNGTLDSGFGTNGEVITRIGSSSASTALALLPDGKIVVAGFCSSGFCAAQYLVNGTLDPGFGSSGTVSTSLGRVSIANTVALQPDGKLLLAGHCVISGPSGATLNFCALRYNADGSLDLGFDSDGKIVTDVGEGEDYARGIAVQPDGKIVLAGECLTANRVGVDFCAVRYNANGTIDTRFGANGKVITEVGNRIDIAYAVAIQPDGKFVLAGACQNADGTSFDFCAIRYDADCSLELDANGTFDASVDGVILVRSMFGFTDAAITQGIAASSAAKRSLAQSASYRNYCAAAAAPQCNGDIDGDGQQTAMVDGLIAIRAMLGVTGTAALNGIVFPPGATRTIWSDIQTHLVDRCGMSLPL